jgi:hypothetical protein
MLRDIAYRIPLRRLQLSIITDSAQNCLQFSIIAWRIRPLRQHLLVIPARMGWWQHWSVSQCPIRISTCRYLYRLSVSTPWHRRPLSTGGLRWLSVRTHRHGRLIPLSIGMLRWLAVGVGRQVLPLWSWLGEVCTGRLGHEGSVFRHNRLHHIGIARG